MKYILLFIFLVAFVYSITQEDFKSLQGPPSEFEYYKLPNPQTGNMVSGSAVLGVHLRRVEGTDDYIYTGPIPIDSEKKFQITVASYLKDFKVKFERPQMRGVWFETGTECKKKVKGTFGWGDNQMANIPSVTYVFESRKDLRGIWNIKITAESKIDLPQGSHAMIVIETSSNFKTFSYMTSYKHVVGEKIGLVTRLFDETKYGQNVSFLAHPPAPLKTEFLLADMETTLPDGSTTVVGMEDKGTTFDEKPNDGVYGATITAEKEGFYAASVVMRGVINGYHFVKTTQHLFSVVSDRIDLEDSATPKLSENDEFVTIYFKVKSTSDLVGKQIKAYAEVHGVDESGKEIPIAWISGMSLIEKRGNDFAYPLKLHLAWLSKSGAVRPTVLKNVYIQSPDTNVPLDQKNSIKLENVFSESVWRNHRVVYTGMTEEMQKGRRPKKYARSLKEGRGKVALIHGYCAGGNPFKTSDFTDYIAFNDPSQSRTIDYFAKSLKEFIEPYRGNGVAFVAHSQGGMASLHLYAFYWSSTDVLSEKSGRIIQTVGTPWLGSALAGSLAKFGKELGIGCGENSDLTRDGAKNWIVTIPMEARKAVHFHTTQYKDWSYCNLALQAVLAWPNDGTSESKFSDLDGGNKVNHVKGYCHTTGMNYPPQCEDSNRNKEMDKNAAR